MELYWISFFLTTLFLGRIKAEDDEATIKERVLKDYEENMPPILYARNEHDTYTVLSVFRVQGIDEVKGEFVFEGIIHFLWTDERLTWESENIKGIRVASHQIWTPFIRILNKVAKPEITLRPLPIIFQGGVWWGPRGVFRTACIPNLKYFPFDQHVCEVEIVSVSEEGDLLQMNYTELYVTHTTYVRRNFVIKNPLWNVLSVTSSKARMKVDVVEYVASVLFLSMLSSLQAVNVSLLARYTKQPSIPFLTLMEKLPKWALIMLALVPRTQETVDETFLFSELSEIDQGNMFNIGDQSTENNEMVLTLEYPWEKYILFLDRLLFYVFGIIILLLIISVMFTE
ncbi:acetylcholine receptor subunit delta [Trichonephila clavata]|uniref:Acetylcholine receptor subunit delta n=1 Tax=Trichonephila clavata TaxID=2740835 RepID=A0A8X6HAJ4_TRICU|nr:acetylcholine receptor subunit delta [Trichonephila clavata]